MTFTKGLVGLVGGLVVMFISALFYSATQFSHPTLAAIFMWVFILGIAIMVLAPMWFWGYNVVRWLDRLVVGE